MSSKAKKTQIAGTDYISLIERGVLGKGDRVELIHGEIVEMSPIGTSHAYVVAILQKLLGAAVGGNFLVWAQSPIFIDEFSIPEPDHAVVKLQNYREQYPGPQDILLVVEVADSSLHYDREVKMPIYASAGIPEFWLVNLKNKTIECYRFPSGTEYQEKKIIYSGENAVFEALSIEIPVDSPLVDA